MMRDWQQWKYGKLDEECAIAGARNPSRSMKQRSLTKEPEVSNPISARRFMLWREILEQEQELGELDLERRSNHKPRT